MPIPWIDLESAFIAVRSDPLIRAWIHRGTGRIRLVADVFEQGRPPPAGTEWVEIPALDDPEQKGAMVEEFVHRTCPELALPVAQCFAEEFPWRRFKDLLALHGLLEDWIIFEGRTTRQAIVAWAAEQALPVALSWQHAPPADWTTLASSQAGSPRARTAPTTSPRSPADATVRPSPRRAPTASRGRS